MIIDIVDVKILFDLIRLSLGLPHDIFGILIQLNIYLFIICDDRVY